VSSWRAPEAGTGADPNRPQSRWWFVVAVVCVAVLGFVNTRWADDRLPGDADSDVRGILAALSAISILMLGLQLVVAGILRDPVDRRMRRPPSMALTAAGAATAAGAVATVAFVVIESSVSFRLEVAVSAGIAVALMIITVPARSVLLGGERWLDLAVIAVLAGLPRFVVTLLGSSGGTFPLLAAVVAGEAIGGGIAILRATSTPRAARWPRGAVRHLCNGVAASTGLALVILLGSVSLRGRLGDDVDAFSQSAALARLPFVLVFAVAFVFFPSMTRHPIGSAELRRIFHRAMLLCSIAAAASLTVILAAPSFAMRMISSDPVASPSTVRVLCVAFALTGVASVSLMQYVAHGSRFALWAWPAAFVTLVGQLTCTTALSLAVYALVSSIVLLVSSSLPALLRVAPVLRPTVVDASGPTAHRVTSGTTVVIPSFNPGPTVLETVEEVIDSFDAAGLDVTVIVVSDGSTDGSPALIDGAARRQLIHVRHTENRGKGAALRSGFALATSPIVGFVDADGDLPPGQLVELVRIQHETNASIVFGSKRHNESSVDVSRTRIVVSRTYQWMIRTLFQLDIRDTQTGIKVFSREVLDAIMPLVREDGYALDLEMFVASRYTGHADFVEVPVRLSRQGSSTISSRSAMRMIGHTLHIFWRAKITLEYLRLTTAEREVAEELSAR
jgi:GT2 family glycosyltransferase